MFLLFSYLLILFTSQVWAGESEGEYARTEYRCQIPMQLTDFRFHLDRGFGHRAIHWNLQALDRSGRAGLNLVQLSVDAVSPTGTLESPGISVSLHPMTLEKRWLESLLRSPVIHDLSEQQQILLRLNETYQIYRILPEDSLRMPANHPFLPMIQGGAYVFTDPRIAIVIDIQQRYLALCPRVNEESPALSSRQLMSELIWFTKNPKIRRFFSCESLLLQPKM